nr:serine/threonine-protein kinase dst1 isoform X1 [Tanacetum cinerariifolium]
MAEGLPPRSNVHPMRVLFMISIEPAPMLEDKEKWSLVFHDFIAKCLTKDPRIRPTASELLKATLFLFVIVPNGVPAVGGTVKAGGLEEAEEGDFGSVIIHGGVGIHKTAAKTPLPAAKDPSHASARGQSLSMADPGEDSVSP